MTLILYNNNIEILGKIISIYIEFRYRLMIDTNSSLEIYNFFDYLFLFLFKITTKITY